MFSLLSITGRITGKITGRLFALLSVLWLAACQTVTVGSNDNGPKIDTSVAVPVALLVPGGSGKASDNLLAKNLENAARLAIADLQGVKIDLRVYNTAGNPAQAANVASEAVDDGAKIILGPLYAQAANAAGVAVAGRNVNVLAFSNNTEIAGGNVFVLGSTFQNTANRLVKFAKSQGKNSIMVVHGQNLPGTVGRDAINNAMASNGVAQAGVTSYEMSQQGIINAAPKIANIVRNSAAQAIFFTASTDSDLPLLTQMLPDQNISSNQVKFIGLTRWDIPPATLSLPGVQGSWFALPHPAMTAKFNSRYNQAYGKPAHPIANLAYDGIAAIGALVKAGKSNALAKSGLTQGSGFVGANGIFRLLPDGTNQRGLAIAEIRNNQAVIVSPAPSSFGGAGS